MYKGLLLEESTILDQHIFPYPRVKRSFFERPSILELHIFPYLRVKGPLLEVSNFGLSIFSYQRVKLFPYERVEICNNSEC